MTQVLNENHKSRAHPKSTLKRLNALQTIFVGPESDHWPCLSLTDSCLVNLIDVTLACEDGNSKLVEVVTVVEVDDEKRVDNSLVQIWKVNFGHKVKFLFGL